MIIPAGYLMDRVGRKWCTVPSTAIPGIVFLLVPATEQFRAARHARRRHRTRARTIFGIVGDFDLRRRAGARPRPLQALRRTIAELGSGIAPLIGGYMANAYNPGMPFLVYAPLLILSATLLAVVGKETLQR